MNIKKLIFIAILILSFALSYSTTIYEIQYTTEAGDGTYPSPLEEDEVTVTGIVTGSHFSGRQILYM